MTAISSLDHFKKQAKLYLRWHREGYFPVAAQIRAHLPRFRHLSEPEVLKTPFKLSDAQELVARTYGCESWTALAQGASSMKRLIPVRSTAIIASEPQIFVSDMAGALRFYTSSLGFKIAFTYGEPPFYAQVIRDGGCINLKAVDGPVFDAEFRVRETIALSATMTLADAKPLFLEFQEAGVPFHQKLRTEPWGARTFIVRDPDGNLLAFAGNLT